MLLINIVTNSGSIRIFAFRLSIATLQISLVCIWFTIAVFTVCSAVNRHLRWIASRSNTLPIRSFCIFPYGTLLAWTMMFSWTQRSGEMNVSAYVAVHCGGVFLSHGRRDAISRCCCVTRVISWIFLWFQCWRYISTLLSSCSKVYIKKVVDNKKVKING